MLVKHQKNLRSLIRVARRRKLLLIPALEKVKLQSKSFQVAHNIARIPS